MQFSSRRVKVYLFRKISHLSLCICGIAVCFSLQSCAWGQIVPLSSIQYTIPQGTFKGETSISVKECRPAIAFSEYHTLTMTAALEKLRQSLPEGAIGFADVEIMYSTPFAFKNNCIEMRGYPVFREREEVQP